jgi:hypothetical protein
MERASAAPARKRFHWLAWLGIWIATTWLLYPLIFIEEVTVRNVKAFFYRSAGGIVIMIILFGKTLFDLLFPQDVSRRKSVVSVVFLTIYSLVMAGGIIFVLVRILLLYLNQNSATFVPR